MQWFKNYKTFAGICITYVPEQNMVKYLIRIKNAASTDSWKRRFTARYFVLFKIEL